MENCSFQGQLLSVMEVLARAAAAEIDRCVGDSCAVLRVEVSQSRRDIELLKRQCEAMEAELRRTRMRARRKVFYPPAADRFTPSVRVVLSEETQSSQWDRQTQPEAQHQPQQCADEAEQVLIKEECAEEDMWKNDSEDKLTTEAELPPCFDASHPSQTDSFAERPHNTVYDPHSAESPTDPGSAVTHTEVYNTTFTEQQLNTHQPQEELVVKLERLESPNENTAPLDTACSSFVTEDTHAQLWPSNQCGETVNSNFLYPGQQFEAAPSSSVFPSQIELHVEGAVPRINSVGKSHSLLNAARVKRRARTFGFRRQQHQQVDEGQNAISNINTMDQCSGPQQPQHQYRDTTNLNDDLTMQSPLGSTFCGQGRTSGSGWPHPARRIIRTPWRCGIGEKRFSCTYCAKSFMRFSLLKEHLRSHTGEKPFSCAQCGRSFTKQCNLQRHAVVHSGEKPYGCSLCGKAFTQRSSLKSHQKTAH